MNVGADANMRRALPLFNAVAVVILTLGIGAILIVAKDILVPVALAVLLSFALSPIANRLQRLGAPGAVAVIVPLLLALLFIAILITAIAGQTADLASKLPAYRSTIMEKIHGVDALFGGRGDFSRAFEVIQEALQNLGAVDASGALSAVKATPLVVAVDHGSTALEKVGAYASPLLQPLALATIVFLLTGFMLAQRRDLRNRAIKLLGTDDIQQTTAAFDDAGYRVGRLLLTQLLLNTIFGAVIALSLAIIGVPNALLWGALAGVLRFIPYIGPIVGLVPPLLVAFAFDPSWAPFLATLGAFVVVEGVTGQVIEPMVYGHSSGLSPFAVVVSALVWAFLWGPLGLVLATPLTICLVVLGRHFPRLEFIETLLGDEPPLLPHELFYQRMLAGDPAEAVAQARELLKARAASTYFDEIALEAIRRAHLDVARGVVSGDRLAALVKAVDQLVAAVEKIKIAPPLLARRSLEASAALQRIRPDRTDARLVVEKGQLPPNWRGEHPVAVLHGADPLDPTAAAMLAQVLTKHGLAARVIALSEAAKLGPDERDFALVCLSFVDPLSTLAHARQQRRRPPRRAQRKNHAVRLAKNRRGLPRQLRRKAESRRDRDDNLRRPRRRLRLLSHRPQTAAAGRLAHPRAPAAKRQRRRRQNRCFLMRLSALSPRRRRKARVSRLRQACPAYKACPKRRRADRP